MATQVRPIEGEARGLGLSRAPWTGGEAGSTDSPRPEDYNEAFEARVDI